MKKQTKKTAGSKTDSNAELRKQLLALLKGGQAHATFDAIVKSFPAKLRGVVPDGLPYSAWKLLDHIRIAQHDILRFSTNLNGKYQSPPWPEGYWAKQPVPPSSKAWDAAVKQVRVDSKAFQQLIANPANDLFALFPWGDGQNLLREALLIADHNAYHLCELLLVRRLLGAWKK